MLKSCLSLEFQVNDTVTNKCWWECDATQELMRLGREGTGESQNSIFWSPKGEMKIVGLLLTEWLEYRSGIFRTEVKGTCPHDALTVLEAVYPGRTLKPIFTDCKGNMWNTDRAGSFPTNGRATLLLLPTLQVRTELEYQSMTHKVS